MVDAWRSARGLITLALSSCLAACGGRDALWTASDGKSSAGSNSGGQASAGGSSGGAGGGSAGKASAGAGGAVPDCSQCDFLTPEPCHAYVCDAPTQTCIL